MDFLGLVGAVAIISLIISIGWLILSIYMRYWAYKKKGVLGLLFALFLNWLGWIIVACMPKEEKQRERERESSLIGKKEVWKGRKSKFL